MHNNNNEFTNVVGKPYNRKILSLYCNKKIYKKNKQKNKMILIAAVGNFAQQVSVK